MEMHLDSKKSPKWGKLNRNLSKTQVAHPHLRGKGKIKPLLLLFWIENIMVIVLP
jgi:hypothetical protein